MRRKETMVRSDLGLPSIHLVGLPVLFSASPELGLAGEFPASY